VVARIEPEPAEIDREAIVAALAEAAGTESEWADAALLEGVDAGDPEP
jgi:hypothetical protein